jgi:hypothetical protein
MNAFNDSSSWYQNSSFNELDNSTLEPFSLVGNLTKIVIIDNYQDINYNLCRYVYDPTSEMNQFEFWINGVLLNLVGVLGILGNILSMVILSRPQMRSSINYLLIGLARCDTMLLLTSVLLFGIPAIYPYTGYFFYYYYYIYPTISPYMFPIATTSQTASVYLTLTVTLERFVAVCHPLRARALCTYGRARIYVVVIIAFALLYNMSRFWEVKVREYPDDQYGKILCLMASELRENSDYINIYIHWLYLVFIYFIPFVSLAFFNTMIYKQVRKANRERQRLSRTEKREIGLATMLFCVVIVFFLCNILALVTNILEAFYSIIDDYLVKTSNLLVTINSSVNFIIYVIFGEKFKRIFLLLFCKKRVGHESPDGLMQDDSSFSNGDGSNRNSGRFQRIGTMRTSTRTNGTSTRVQKTSRVRAPSPGPIVYYPARETFSKSSPTSTTLIRSTSMYNSDWHKEGTNGNGSLMSNSVF